MSPIKILKNSLLELKKVQSLAAIAMLLAICVLLGAFANTSLMLFGSVVKIKFTFLPIAVAGSLFGPVPALLVGALGDVLSFIIYPSGAYIPGFTINAALTGMIFGFFFYRNKINIPRVVIAWFINALIVETFLAALWFYIFMNPGSGTPYTTFLVTRLISVAIKGIPEMIVIYGIGRFICFTGKIT